MSAINEVPQGWELVKIQDIFNFIGGGTPSKQEPTYWNGGLNWASVKDIKGDYLFRTEDTITELGAKNSSTNIAYPGDVILITRINPGRTITSKIKTAVNQDLKIIKPKFETHPDFVKYLFASIERKCVKLSSGTTVLGLSLNNLNEIQVLLPPLPEQHRIVAKIEELFSSLDKGIESLKTARQQLKIYRQAVLKWAFEGKLTNEDVKEGELPDGWKWVKLGKVIEKPRYGTSKKCSYGNAGIGVLRIPNIAEGTIADEDLKFAEFEDSEIDFYRLQEGDILTIRSNGSVSLVGKCALIQKRDEKYLYAGYLIRLRPIPDSIISKFLLYALTSNQLRNQIEEKAKSTSGVNNINSEELASLIITIPSSLEEQYRIVAEIESRLSVCDKIEESISQSLQQAEALRQSILKQAFEGKLVPQNPTDEPASVLLERIRTEREQQQSVVKKGKAKKSSAQLELL